MADNEFDNYLSSAFLEANKRRTKTYFSELKANYSGLLPLNKNTAILDIGCGMGQFVMYLGRSGYTNVTGIDVGREAIEYCKAAGINNVFKTESTVDFLAKNPAKFDFIILKSVIAHLPREGLVATLSAMRNSLREGGKLAVETFNASIWTGVFMRYNDFTHRNAFTENSLRQVLFMAGFTKVEIRPSRYAIAKPGQVISFLVRTLWQGILRCIYVAERGIGSNPRLFSKLLIAVAEK